MKFNNPIVVFDLETNADPDNQAITEIGAVVLDENLRLEDRMFQSFVRPDFPVTQRSLDITGHDPKVLAEARPWSEVVGEFETWVEDHAHENVKKVRLAAWGNYFDVNVLRAQYKRHGVVYPFSGTCLDVKTAALMWAALSGRRTDKMSVQHCADEMSLVPTGTYHSALVDALMTARIFQRVMAEVSGGVWVDAGGFKKYVRVTA
jgi:DNA polymerase III epsilon subunit-like protein